MDKGHVRDLGSGGRNQRPLTVIRVQGRHPDIQGALWGLCLRDGSREASAPLNPRTTPLRLPQPPPLPGWAQGCGPGVLSGLTATLSVPRLGPEGLSQSERGHRRT